MQASVGKRWQESCVPDVAGDGRPRENGGKRRARCEMGGMWFSNVTEDLTLHSVLLIVYRGLGGPRSLQRWDQVIHLAVVLEDFNTRS